MRSLRILLRKVQRLVPCRSPTLTLSAIVFVLMTMVLVHKNGYEAAGRLYVPSPRHVYNDPFRGIERNTIEDGDVGSETMKGFDNETAADRFIVPNIIHFVRFNLSEYTFMDYVVLRAAMRNHRPDHFFIHTDTPNFTGKYWNLIRQDHEIWSRIRILPLELPTEVFGQKLSEDWQVFHGSDYERILIMMEYGGIYLDNDVFVLKNLDKYRRFEMVMTWNDNGYLENQIIICNKNAAFLGPWLESYRDYREDEWYYNGGVKPTTDILQQHPEMMHRVKGWFGADSNMVRELYETEDFDDWRRYDAVHLLLGHRHYLDRNYNDTPEFDENNIKTYPYPFGTMVREVLDDNPGTVNVLRHRG